MSTRYARLRPQMTAGEAISYLQRQARDRVEMIYYSYVLDPDQRLLGVVSFRDLFAAEPGRRVADIMETDVVRVTSEMDQEAVSRVFAEHGFTVVPVVDGAGRMQGIVTVDDIVEVVHEEATEDGAFEHELIPTLALFLPLIISSGGNSGSQASTLVIRAMALGEVRTADWFLVMRRELALGAFLGVCAALRVLLWGAAGGRCPGAC